jgi:hypothetical protein
MFQLFVHLLVIERLKYCLDVVRKDETTLVSPSHNQQDMCRVALVIYSVLIYVHGITALIIVWYGWALRCHQELVFGLGIVSVSIWVARIIISFLQLQNNEDETITQGMVLFCASMVAGLFDLQFCIDRSTVGRFVQYV